MEHVDKLSQMRKTFLETLALIPTGKIEETICGESWNVKHVLSHIIGWDYYFADIVKGLKAHKEIPFQGDRIQYWNDFYVNERKDKSWQEIQDEFIKSSQYIIDEYSSLEGEIWEQNFWEDKNATPDTMLRRCILHTRVHLQGIKEKIEEWK